MSRRGAPGLKHTAKARRWLKGTLEDDDALWAGLWPDVSLDLTVGLPENVEPSSTPDPGETSTHRATRTEKPATEAVFQERPQPSRHRAMVRKVAKSISIDEIGETT